MKLAIYSLSLLVALLSSAAFSADDEYDYRVTPVADQIADLMDEDKDGVINARDKCPQTPMEAFIDNDGCEEYFDDKEGWDLKVLFDNDSANISPAFLGEIGTMVEFLKKYPETSIELQGHASVIGEPDYNLKLSEERAIQVQEELVSRGIDSSRVKIVGFGESAVADPGKSQISHAQNRRVVATVVGYDRDIIKEWNIFSKRKKHETSIK